MDLNTVVKLPDGRVGTICWHNLDGYGGVWGRHKFEMPQGGFGDLPRPDFMLRHGALRPVMVDHGHKEDVECVGEEYEVVSGEE